LNLNGDSVWSNVYDTAFLANVFGNAIIALDSSYLVAGHPGINFDGHTFDGYLFHFDALGQIDSSLGPITNTNQYKTPSYLVKTDDGGFFLGSTYIECNSPPDCFEYGTWSSIIKFDSTFNISWQNPKTNAAFYGVQAIRETKAGFIAIASTDRRFSIPINPPNDIGRLNLWNYDIQGNSVVGLSKKDVLSNALKIFPNPTEGLIQVTLDQSINEIGTFRVIDLNGRVKSQRNIEFQQQKFDLSNLQNGIYIYEIELGGQVIRDKLIIQK
jgi:hypothetical protein